MSLLRAELTTYRYAPHMHDAYVIAVTEAGGASIMSQGRTEEALPSTIFLSNPREPQAASMLHNGQWRYRAFYVSESAAKQMALALGLDHLPYFTTPLYTDTTLSNAIIALHRSLEAMAVERTHVYTRLIDAIGHLVERCGAPKCATIATDDDVVRDVITIMYDQYADRLQLDDLSALVGVSPFQLIALFKRSIGMTPYTYLTQIRLRAAQQYLMSGHSITYAAAASGFYDQSAFTRHFKGCYGITPLQFVAARAARTL